MEDEYRIDSTKLMFHPNRVLAWKDSGDDWEKAKSVYPIYAEITTSAACNHRCTFCSVDAIGYPAIMLDRDILAERMREMQALGIKSVMFAGTGEPLLHKKINEIVLDAKGCGLDVAFTTNGVLLDKLETIQECTWVKVSLNAGTKQTYAAVHRTKGKDWDTVWANIADASKRKGNCTLGVQTVLLPENRLELFWLAHLCRDAGADYLVIKPYSQGTFSITKIYEGISYQNDLGLEQALATLNSDTFKVIFRAQSMKQESEEHKYEKCNATPFFWCYALATGDLFSCSAHLLDQRFLLGNLNTQTFKEIWEGERRRKNWELMKGFNIKQCRKNCRMNSANIYLADIDRAKHINFI